MSWNMPFPIQPSNQGSYVAITTHRTSMIQILRRYCADWEVSDHSWTLMFSSQRKTPPAAVAGVIRLNLLLAYGANRWRLVSKKFQSSVTVEYRSACRLMKLTKSLKIATRKRSMSNCSNTTAYIFSKKFYVPIMVYK
jgi:hypothetical protein